LNSLKFANGILQKGHNAHQSLRLVYILIALLLVVVIIAVVELLFFWNRQVSQDFSHSKLNRLRAYLIYNNIGS
jgi:flagellar basal body-associated protein FliL